MQPSAFETTGGVVFILTLQLSAHEGAGGQHKAGDVETPILTTPPRNCYADVLLTVYLQLALLPAEVQ